MEQLAPYFLQTSGIQKRKVKRQSILFQSHRKKFYKELQLCSLLTDSSYQILPEFDTAYPLMMDKIQSSKNLTFCSQQAEEKIIKRGHKLSTATTIPHEEVNLPTNFVEMIQETIRRLSDEYKHLFVDRVITYYKGKNKSKTEKGGFLQSNGQWRWLLDSVKIFAAVIQAIGYIFYYTTKYDYAKLFQSIHLFALCWKNTAVGYSTRKDAFPEKHTANDIEDDDFIFQTEDIDYCCPDVEALITSQARYFTNKYPTLFQFKGGQKLSHQKQKN